MPSISPRKLLKFLKKKGFYVSRQSGSHMILHHKEDVAKHVTLPIHNKDLKQGTLSSVLEQAGVERKELFKK